MNGGSRIQVNTTMACLDWRFEELSRQIEGLDRAKVARVSGIFCPYSLLTGEKHEHKSNGDYVVVHDGTVYCSCTSRTLGKDIDGMRFDLLAGGRADKPWVVITEERLAQLKNPFSLSDAGTLLA